MWIENSAGIKGIIYSESGSTSKFLHIIMKLSLCQIDTSYSGLACTNFFTLVPGTYKLSVMSWGRISNKVDFTIVSNNGGGGYILLGPT